MRTDIPLHPVSTTTVQFHSGAPRSPGEHVQSLRARTCEYPPSRSLPRTRQCRTVLHAEYIMYRRRIARGGAGGEGERGARRTSRRRRPTVECAAVAQPVVTHAHWRAAARTERTSRRPLTSRCAGFSLSLSLCLSLSWLSLSHRRRRTLIVAAAIILSPPPLTRTPPTPFPNLPSLARSSSRNCSSCDSSPDREADSSLRMRYRSV